MAYQIDQRDEDRLPWLETVEADEPEPSGIARAIVLALIGLAIVAGLVFAGYTILGQRAAGGDGALIAAEEGDYKIRPDDPGGLDVQGEGDTAIATSAGAPGDAVIDWSAVPEAPITGRPPSVEVVPETPDRMIPSVPAPTAKPAMPPPLVAPAPAPKAAPRVDVPGAASGGSLVQLGAFPTEAAANAAWGALSRRFGYVAVLGKQVRAAEVSGLAVYRLRVDAGSAAAAADLCGRLKVAGERCFVTN